VISAARWDHGKQRLACDQEIPDSLRQAAKRTVRACDGVPLTRTAPQSWPRTDSAPSARSVVAAKDGLVAGVVWWCRAVTGVRVEYHRGAASRTLPGQPCAWASIRCRQREHAHAQSSHTVRPAASRGEPPDRRGRQHYRGLVLRRRPLPGPRGRGRARPQAARGRSRRHRAGFRRQPSGLRAGLRCGGAAASGPGPAAVREGIYRFFARRLDALRAAGIGSDRLIIDPGLGYFLGGTPGPSLAVLAGIRELKETFGIPVLVSPSRKSFLRAITGRDVAQSGPATLAAEIFAAWQGADYIRTHDVAAARDALAFLSAISSEAGLG
jgi:Pterin binding enzyme